MAFWPNLIINWTLMGKMSHYMTNVGSVLIGASSWLVVALTIDRLILIKFPFKAKQLSTPTRANVAIFVIYLGVIGIVGFWIFEFFEVPININDCTGYWAVPKQVPTGNGTFYIPHRFRKSYHWFAVVSLLLALYVTPVAILIVCNVLIIKWLRSAPAIAARNAKKRQKEKRLAKMIVVVSFIYITCNILDTVTRLLWIWVDPHLVGNLQSIGHVLLMINVGANFVVYALMNKNLFTTIYVSVKRCFGYNVDDAVFSQQNTSGSAQPSSE